MTLSVKEKRAFNRLVSGLTIGSNQGAFYRFLTLTSSVESLSSYYYRRVKTAKGIFYFPTAYDINRSFDILKKRILRATSKRDGFKGFKFNKYFKLKTTEGNGVLHIIYWGSFIPKSWLSKAWEQIHLSPIVDIEAAYGEKGRDVKGLVGYLLTNYLTKQPIKRMSYSWHWAWLGVAKSWVNVKNSMRCLRSSDKVKGLKVVKSMWQREKRYVNGVLDYWNSLLDNPKPVSRQIKFCNSSHTKLSSHIEKSKYFEGWSGELTPVAVVKSEKVSAGLSLADIDGVLENNRGCAKPWVAPVHDLSKSDFYEQYYDDAGVSHLRKLYKE